MCIATETFVREKSSKTVETASSGAVLYTDLTGFSLVLSFSIHS